MVSSEHNFRSKQQSSAFLVQAVKSDRFPHFRGRVKEARSIQVDASNNVCPGSRGGLEASGNGHVGLGSGLGWFFQ